MREGIAELDGEGEAVGGIVLMRPGQNALDTIAAVKARIGDLERGLPEGVELVTVYDRSGLIHRAINTPSSRLVEELLIIALVCAAFLLHLRSSLVVILCLPIGILMAFVAMRLQGVSTNIMSLGGIAIGAMVDASVVMVDGRQPAYKSAFSQRVPLRLGGNCGCQKASSCSTFHSPQASQQAPHWRGRRSCSALNLTWTTAQASSGAARSSGNRAIWADAPWSSSNTSMERIVEVGPESPTRKPAAGNPRKKRRKRKGDPTA